MSATVRTTSCRNCGTELYGRFCARCGQEDQPLDPTLRDVVGEAAREISSLDGRIARSVRRLFLSPGFLTLEHVRGRRVAWVSPIRLYLIFSVAYFGLVAFTGTFPLDLNMQITASGGEEDAQALRELHFSSEEELRRAVNEALITWIPRAMFVLVPLFGWMVSRVRRASAHKYPHHLIFALHIFAAFFGIQAVAVALGYVTGSARVTAVLGVASLLYSVAYLVLALRRVYGGTAARAIGHGVILLVFYWVATVAAAAAIVFPALFLGRS